MKLPCPYCGQHLEGDDALAGTFVDCPKCGKTFFVPKPQSTGASAPPSLSSEATKNDELDAVNRLLERMIGNIAHAILGIVRRIWQIVCCLARGIRNFARWLFECLFDIIRFFFSLRFAKFLVLLAVFLALLAMLGGIVAGPFFLWLWLRRARSVIQLATSPGSESDEIALDEFHEDEWDNPFLPENSSANSDPSTAENSPFWWLFHANDLVISQALAIEIVWIILIAGWGIWMGVKSYKRGVIARWRARWKEKTAARRAARQAAKNAE